MSESRRPPLWILGLGAVLAIGLIVAVLSSLRRPSPPVFRLTQPLLAEVGDSLVTGRVTLDARSADRWSFFDFSRNAPVRDPAPLDWDLAVRRTAWIVNGGSGFAGHGGAQASEAAYEDLALAPDRGYAGTTVSGGDSSSAVFDRWYRYDYLSHLLWPKPTSFVLRTADGRYAKLAVESYYCPGPEAGCVTFRYTYQGNGTRELDSPPEAVP